MQIKTEKPKPRGPTSLVRNADMRVHSITAIHDIVQNSSYPPHNHHSTDVVYSARE